MVISAATMEMEFEFRSRSVSLLAGNVFLANPSLATLLPNVSNLVYNVDEMERSIVSTLVIYLIVES